MTATWRSAVAATHDFLSPDDRARMEVEVSEFLPRAPAWLVFDAADRAVGFMVFRDGQIDALFVDASARGIGIGRLLVAHALARHPVLTTDTYEQNVQALGFYERLGFKPVGRSPTVGRGRPYPLIQLVLRGGLTLPEPASPL